MHTVKYLVSVAWIVIGNCILATVILVNKVAYMYSLKNTDYVVAYMVVFSFMVFFGFRFYVPKVRNFW